MFDIFVVRKVDFFGNEETFFHTDTKISDSFDLFTLLSITNSELRHPNTVDIFLTIFYNVIEDNI